MSIKDEDLLAAISSGIDNTGDSNDGGSTDTGGANDGNDAGDAGSGSDASTNGDAGEGDQGGAGAGGEADEQTPGDAATDGDSSDGSDGEDDEGGEDEGDDADESEGEEGSDGKGEELGPDGKPLTKEQKRAKEEAENAEAAKKDPINAPISPYLKRATQERMHTLVNIAKTVTAERDRALQDRDDMISMVRETGASAQQYSQALQYLAAVNSREPAAIQQAIAFLQNELQVLSRMGGVPVPGVNGYESHADLKSAVEAKQITAELANEIAAGRDHRQFQQQSSQAQQQAAQQQQQRQQQEWANGKEALNNIGRQLAAQDPNYKTKAPLVLKSIQENLKKANPSQWANMFLLAYTTYKAPVAKVVAPKPKTPKNQPLRANNPSGGQQGTPKSLEDAISLGIAAGTRR